MSVQTFKFPSRSSDATHTVTVGANGQIVCTCRGFRTPEKCWHVHDVAAQLGKVLGSASQPIMPFIASIDAHPFPPNLSTSFIEPMLGRALKDSESIEAWVGRPDYSLEEKYDGHRVIVHISEKRIITIWSRDANIINDRVGKHIGNFLSIVPPGTYDGELFIPGKQSTDVTRKDLRHRQKLALFDILRIHAPHLPRVDSNGFALTTHLILRDRRALLAKACEHIQPASDVFIAPIYPVKKETLQSIWNAGGEGVMVKCNLETYQSGYRRWIKFKKEATSRMTITGYKPGKLGPQARIVGKDAHGIEVRCKTLDTRMRAALEANPESFKGKTLVFVYTQKTEDGRYRHPRADHIEE